jgi:hypothetical protein
MLRFKFKNGELPCFLWLHKQYMADLTCLVDALGTIAAEP